MELSAKSMGPGLSDVDIALLGRPGAWAGGDVSPGKTFGDKPPSGPEPAIKRPAARTSFWTSHSLVSHDVTAIRHLACVFVLVVHVSNCWPKLGALLWSCECTCDRVHVCNRFRVKVWQRECRGNKAEPNDLLQNLFLKSEHSTVQTLPVWLTHSHREQSFPALISNYRSRL